MQNPLEWHHIAGSVSYTHLAGKGLGAAGDKANGGLEAGKRYGDGEDQQTDPAEEGLRDLRQRYTAVFGCGQYAAALGAHGGDGNIDKPHESVSYTHLTS